jgi:hypothetical protein
MRLFSVGERGKSSRCEMRESEEASGRMISPYSEPGSGINRPRSDPGTFSLDGLRAEKSPPRIAFVKMIFMHHGHDLDMQNCFDRGSIKTARVSGLNLISAVTSHCRRRISTANSHGPLLRSNALASTGSVGIREVASPPSDRVRSCVRPPPSRRGRVDLFGP